MKVDAGELRALHEKGVPLPEIARRFRLALPVVYEAILTVKAAARPPLQRSQAKAPAVVFSAGVTAPARETVAGGRTTVLSAQAVAVARKTVAEGRATVAEVANGLHLPHSTVYSAVYGLSWRSVTDPPPLPRPAAIGESAASVLTVDDVAEARRMYVSHGGPSIRDLALRFGVGDTTIWSAIHGLSWTEITDPAPVPIAARPGRQYIPDEDVQLIVELRDQGGTWEEIGGRIGVHKSSALRAYRRAKQLT